MNWEQRQNPSINGCQDFVLPLFIVNACLSKRWSSLIVSQHHHNCHKLVDMWHLLTSADTCCHNMSQSADISSKHGHGMTWPLPSILYRAPPEDPGRSGRTNSWMHPWFHPWTHHRTYLNLLEPTWTHLNPLEPALSAFATFATALCLRLID